MPRKRSPDPDKSAALVKRARWRCVIRNSAFRREMREVGEALRDRPRDGIRALMPFLHRWGLSFVPAEWVEAFAVAEDTRGEVAFLERLETIADYWPVLVSEYDWGKRFVTMTVDVSCPVTELLPAIATEIRPYAQSWSTSAPGRRRLDKLDFQLQVYDRFVATRSFSLAAKELKRPVTTIRSAFWSAIRAIGESVPERTQKAFRLHSIGEPAQHKEQCPTCKAGETFCAAMWAWVNQDAVPQRELPVGLDPGAAPTQHKAKGRRAAHE